MNSGVKKLINAEFHSLRALAYGGYPYAKISR